MAILAEQVFSETMSPIDRERAARRSNELIEQYLTLQQLRKARKLTQVQLGSRTGKDQVAISHIERRTDMLLSTVRTYVEAMGGTLTLMVQFEDRKPVFLTGLTDEEPKAAPRAAGETP